MKYEKNYFEVNKNTLKKMNKIYNILKSMELIINLDKYKKEYNDIFQKEEWKEFKGMKKIIDYGCGEGQFLKYKPDDTEVYGVEVQRNQIVRLRKEGYTVLTPKEFYSKFKENSIDGIYCAHVIEHVSKPKELLTHFYKILKPGGILQIKTPNFAKSYFFFYDDPTHVMPFTKAKIFRLLSEIGYRKIEIKYGYTYFPYDSIIHVIMALLLPFPNIRLKIQNLLGSILQYELNVRCKK